MKPLPASSMPARSRRSRAVAVLALLLAVPVAPLAAAPRPPLKPPAILKVSELKPGMKGVGKTVLRGLDVSLFDFEVMDVVESEGFSNDLILIKVSGPTVDAFGGIAAGMSGSPLYIDDKLIGAISMTTPSSDTHYGYATPIEDMLKLLGPPAKTAQASAPLLLSSLPARTPIMVSGLGGRARHALAGVLKRHGLTHLAADPVPVNPAAPAPAAAGDSLAPGQAVAASLTTGDVALTALGTVTWRDGNKLLAFGHPFMRRGETAVFMHPAFIYGVVPSQEVPFKIGAPAGPPVGVFHTDRAAGIAGRVGQAIDTFDLSVRVRDASMARERTLSVKVIRDPELAPVLAAVCVMQAMDEVMDRDGGGTATVRWELQGRGLADTLTRDDVVYSGADIVSEVLAAPLFALDAVLKNDFAAVSPTKMTITVDVSAERRTARLVSLKCNPSKVKPGGTVHLQVTLQPYRGQSYTRELALQVPDDVAPGRLVVEVHGRDQGRAGPLSLASLLASGLPAPGSLADLLAALSTTQRGDALAAELLPPEAAEARQQALDKLSAQPAAQLFSEEALAIPAFDLSPGSVSATPLARKEERVEQVVLGRLSHVLTVVGESSPQGSQPIPQGPQP